MLRCRLDASEDMKVQISRGEPLPLGLHDCHDGTNLAVFSRHAVGMALLLYDSIGAIQPCLRIDLEPDHHRTGDIWHVRLHGDLRGMLYALQTEGPAGSAQGHRFQPDQPLLEPYAASVSGTAWSLPPTAPSEPVARTHRCVVTDH